MRINISKLIKKIKNNLTPDLLQRKYVKKNKKNKTFGHCYVATETLYYLLKDKSFIPHVARDFRNNVHWWLQNKEGKILDVTKEQYLKYNKKPPYNKGYGNFFITNKPCKRTKLLMNRLKSI
jgi:hypothetical protein